MKKTMAIVGVIVLGWLGVTAYISSTFKGEVDQYLESINRVSASQGIHYKAEVKSGFFTSDVTLVIDIDEERFGKDFSDVYADVVSLPVKLDYRVEHGPIFYKNGLGFGFAKFNTEVKASEILAEEPEADLLNAIPEDITFYLTEVLCFDKKLKINMHSNAITLTDNGEKIEMEPIVGNGVIDMKTLLGSLDITLPKITAEGNGLTAMIHGATLHIDMKELVDGKYLLNDVVFKVAKVNIQQDGLSKPVEMDFVAEVKTEREEGEFFMAVIDMQLNQEGLEQLSPKANEIAKQVNFSVKWNGISVKALRKIEEMNQKQTEMMDGLSTMMNETDQSKAAAAQQKAEVAQEAFLNTTKEALQALLVKDRTKVSVSIDLTTKDNARSKISVTAGYVGEALQGELEEIVAYLQRKPLEYLTLDVDIDFNEKHLALNPSPQAQQQAKMGFDRAVLQGMMNLENGIYSTKLEYEPKILKINGQDKSQEILPILEMSLGQGAMN